MQSNEEEKQPQIKDIKPVLLSKSELQLLLGNVKFSKPFEYKMKNSIKRKIQTLTELELPLLIKNNFLVSSYYGIDDDDGLGRDLEPGPPTQSLSVNSSLVRQRSRDRIPAKASLFCKKEGESGFSSVSTILPKMLRSLPNIVRLSPDSSTYIKYKKFSDRYSKQLFYNVLISSLNSELPYL